nr:DNA adenine methylase [Treponema phagedenis]
MFAKEPSQAEVINDTNAEIINFYQVVQEDFPALQKEIMKTLHSREMHRHAKIIYENPDMFDTVKEHGLYGCKLICHLGIVSGRGLRMKKE